MPPLLSILTPAIWKRADQSRQLARDIDKAIIDWHCERLTFSSVAVEHLVIFDNRARSIGLKRQACLDAARGQYVAFVDDDDDIADTYVADLLDVIVASAPDVITFEQRVIIDEAEGRCVFGLRHQDEPFAPDGTFKRAPWHVCAWKRELVKDCVFPDNSYGEDLTWCLQARRRVRTSVHIPRVLHTYRYSSSTSAAPVPV